MFSKVPISEGGNFSTEPQEIALQSSMPASIPLSLIAEEPHHQPMRPQYTYLPSSSAPRHMSMSASSHLPADHASNIPRYLDDVRPAKAARVGLNTVASSGSVGPNDSTPDYRYGSYGSVNSATGDVIPATYGPEGTGATATGSRDVYPPPPQGWRPATSDTSHSVSYTGGDSRTYAASYDHYKGRPSAGQVKEDPGQASHPGPYGSGHRGSFDAMNNYSWSSN